MSDLPDKIEVREDGSMVLSQEAFAAILNSHLEMIRCLPDVDRAMLMAAKDGGVKAATLIYQRLGLLRGKASSTKPEMPDIPTHELQAEMARRGMLVESKASKVVADE